MPSELWDRVLAGGRGKRFVPIPGEACFLRVQVSDGTLGERGVGEIVVADRRGHAPGNERLRLYFRPDGVTLKTPMSLSGQKWRPGVVLSGTTLDDAGPPTERPAEPLHAWLDGALERMLAQARPPV